MVAPQALSTHPCVVAKRHRRPKSNPQGARDHPNRCGAAPLPSSSVRRAGSLDLCASRRWNHRDRCRLFLSQAGWCKSVLPDGLSRSGPDARPPVCGHAAGLWVGHQAGQIPSTAGR